MSHSYSHKTVLPTKSNVDYLCGAAGAQRSAVHVEGELVYKVRVGCQPAQAESGSQELGKAIKADHPTICVQGHVAFAQVPQPRNLPCSQQMHGKEELGIGERERKTASAYKHHDGCLSAQKQAQARWMNQLQCQVGFGQNAVPPGSCTEGCACGVAGLLSNVPECVGSLSVMFGDYCLCFGFFNLRP